MFSFKSFEGGNYFGQVAAELGEECELKPFSSGHTKMFLPNKIGTALDRLLVAKAVDPEIV